MRMLTNLGLIAFAISLLGKAYMWGYTGIVTEAIIQMKAKQYPSIYTEAYIIRTRKNIGKWATDCSGLVDAYLGVDLSAAGYYSQASRRGKISDIPRNIPGILVFKVNTKGVINHVGVSMGDGTVIEAKGVDYGVVRTKLDGTGWDLYAYCHLLTYVETAEATPVATPSNNPDEISKGSKGAIVTNWQNCLLYFGYSLPKYGADGDFGTETLTATMLFQSRHELLQDGVVGKNTWGKLLEELREEEADLSSQLTEVRSKIEMVSNYIK